MITSMPAAESSATGAWLPMPLSTETTSFAPARLQCSMPAAGERVAVEGAVGHEDRRLRTEVAQELHHQRRAGEAVDVVVAVDHDGLRARARPARRVRRRAPCPRAGRDRGAARPPDRGSRAPRRPSARRDSPAPPRRSDPRAARPDSSFTRGRVGAAGAPGPRGKRNGGVQAQAVRTWKVVLYAASMRDLLIVRRASGPRAVTPPARVGDAAVPALGGSPAAACRRRPGRRAGRPGAARRAAHATPRWRGARSAAHGRGTRGAGPPRCRAGRASGLSARGERHGHLPAHRARARAARSDGRRGAGRDR